jgi:acetyl-CoA carboxylase carboxyl transferase subunit alpha
MLTPDRVLRLYEVRVEVVLDFERPILELRKRIDQLRALQVENGVNLAASIEQLEIQQQRLEERIFSQLSPWQRTLLSRHPNRPFTLDYVEALFTEWFELHGDRAGYDDAAMVCGIARFDGRPIAVVGQQKGRNTKENIRRNFAMARPEGYRKALRIMQLADDQGLPLFTFIDTPGAFPGVDAEQRGQAEAIARNIRDMARLTIPVIATIIGEGGSGGALALGVADRVLMLENSIYSVISPEGCAAILWRDRAEAPRAAEALRVTASDCADLGVIDEIIPEPFGGAHRHPSRVFDNVRAVLRRHLGELSAMSRDELKEDRYSRFRRLGRFQERV